MHPTAALNIAICEAVGLTPQDVAVSVGNMNDRATWKLNWIVAPTREQIKLADAVIAVFDMAAVPPPTDELADIKTRLAALEARS